MRGRCNIRSVVRASARSAFTLLEVLMALVIFALAAVVLGSAYVNVLNSYEVAARGTLTNPDATFARQIVLGEPDRKKLEEGGDFDTAGGQKLRWSVEITSTNIADLFNVALTLESGDRPGNTPPTPMVFTVLRPTWSIDPAERAKLKEETKKRIMEIQGKNQQQR
ncbi:MAG TPA: prepilin-type N-terminal cleavage/methylation domain-containing protein [Opitutaceae bacterium]|nr:prepilin-type N-terminal cleavage/methylation domain-containing protein [Opitutaceae bacterium]